MPQNDALRRVGVCDWPGLALIPIAIVSLAYSPDSLFRGRGRPRPQVLRIFSLETLDLRFPRPLVHNLSVESYPLGHPRRSRAAGLPPYRGITQNAVSFLRILHYM